MDHLQLGLPALTIKSGFHQRALGDKKNILVTQENVARWVQEINMRPIGKTWGSGTQDATKTWYYNVV